MATGRTHHKWLRFYADGYDLSGYARMFGPLAWEFEEADLTCPFGDAAKGYLPDVVSIGVGTYAGVLDNTATTGLHTVLGTPGSARVIMAPFGIRAAPITVGLPVFVGRFQQLDYQAREEGKASVVSIPFGAWDTANMMGFEKPWGRLLHYNTAETGANSASGDDEIGASSALGGYMVYQVFAGDGTATISVDDSADNSAFTALSGATSGELDCSTRHSGLVGTTVTATVRRYLRWQLSLNTATTVTFALAFVRAH